MGKKVAAKADELWKEGMFKKGAELKSTLRYYCKKGQPKYEGYLRDDWEKKREVFKIRTGQAMFHAIKSRWDGKVDERCVLCRKERETEEHVLLECPKLGDMREMLMEKLLQVVGKERWDRFLTLDKEGQMTWVLRLDDTVAGLGSRRDWKEIFSWIGRMVYKRDRAAENLGKNN